MFKIKGAKSQGCCYCDKCKLVNNKILLYTYINNKLLYENDDYIEDSEDNIIEEESNIKIDNTDNDESDDNEIKKLKELRWQVYILRKNIVSNIKYGEQLNHLISVNRANISCL